MWYTENVSEVQMSEVSSGRQTPVPPGSHRSSLSSGGAPPAPGTATGSVSGSGTGLMAKSMSCGGYRYTSGALRQVHLAPLGRTYLFEQFLGTLAVRVVCCLGP